MADNEVQPKPTSDAADLVIKFVGILATVVTMMVLLVGSALTIVGYKTFGDIKADVVKEVKEQTSDAKKELMETMDKYLKQRVETVSLLQVQTWVQDSASLYSQYKHVFESLVLDSLTEFQFEEIKAIQRNLALLQEMNVAEIRKNIQQSSLDNKAEMESNLVKAEAQLNEIHLVLHAVYDYKCDTEEELPDECEGKPHQVKHALDDINGLYNVKTPMKYRMLFSVYSKLFRQQIELQTGALREQSTEGEKKKEAQKYLSGLQGAAKKYTELSNRTNVNVKLIQAIALAREAQFIERYERDKGREKSKYNDAIQFLKTAEELGPSDVIAYYLAAYYSHIEMFDEAMGQLRKVKNWGGLKSAQEVTSFKHDPDFEKLRNFRGDELKKLNL